MEYNIQIQQYDGGWHIKAVIVIDEWDDSALDYLRGKAKHFVMGAVHRARVVDSETDKVLAEFAGGFHNAPVDVLNNPLAELQEMYGFTDEEVKAAITAYRKKK